MAVTIQDVKNTALSAPTIAMVVTAFRLFERIRSRKFGIDDVFALLSAVMLLIFVVSMFVHLVDPNHLSRITKLGLYYTLSELFYGVLWCARLSILFSIVRISPSIKMRRTLYVLAGAFGVCWAILFAQDFWTCENEPGWKDMPSPQCFLGSRVAITQLITDVFADSCLIAFPMRLLWNLRVSKGQRLRLLLIFSTSIITSIVSLVHAYYVLRVGGLEELVVAIVENAVSLIVCNSAVIITTIMRLMGSGGEDDSPSRQETYTTSGYWFSKKSTTSTTANSIQLTAVRSVTTKVDYDGDVEPGRGEPPKVLPKWDWPAVGREGEIPREHLVRFSPGQDQDQKPV
ncbi:hypothetical protein BDZ94DRAFT_1308357 [Collybia nuda]|uniref:Rhodopsin domain-containing protein n=1 Tax=Collybia nuda TaxID=64659 RepID=A0A9P5Y7U3_9AGAR|nr:hypothetical protein BDZ94DRAFT_1308357 [Collybia nuda]